jgi:hypothetical protein
LLDCEEAVALFDPPSFSYPKKWKEFSFDYILQYVFGICMFVLCMYGTDLSIKRELLAIILLAVILVSLSQWYRRRMNWRWPGVDANGLLNATISLLVACTYEYAVIPFAPLSDPRLLPANLVGLMIFALILLRSLNVVEPFKVDFLRQCAATSVPDHGASLDTGTVPVVTEDPFWKRSVRTVYGAVFHLVWFDSAAFLYFFGIAMRNGSPKPTPMQTDLLIISAKDLYVQHGQKILIYSLLAVYLVGMASVMLSGLIIHFFLGVRLYPKMTTFQDWRRQRQRN